jgi:predicted DsbA family dithiol-disulfide isomerase
MQFGIEEREIKRWLKSGVAYEDLQFSENSAERAGLNGTPAWMVDGQLISGLQSRAYFQQFRTEI